jgi:tetratricopeptide (TPR) repeat protein
MLVTLPFVLLLLDYWPLGRLRFAKKSFGWLIAEKIPLIFVALTWGIITFAIQKQAGVVVAETQLGPVSRIANAAISYVFYLWKTIWPTDLAVFYPYPSRLPWISFVFSTLLLIAISVFCVAKRKNFPYLIFGWLWYLGTLIPVIGVIQSGGQARADRYTYLPQIGFCLAVIWQINDLSERWPHRRYLVGTAAAVALLFLAGRTWTQCAIWHNSESLWSHALAVTTDNATAHNHLADAFIRRGRLDEAVSQAELAIKISTDNSPDNLYGYSNLGIALSRQGKTKEAMKYFEKVEKDAPNRPVLHYNMASALSDNGQWDEAISELQKELVIQPEFAEAHNNLAVALSKKGHLDEAIAQFQKALLLNPNAPKVNYNLAGIFLQKGEMDAAIRHLKRELQIQPNQLDALNDLGIALSQEGLLSEALDQWQRTISVQPNNLNALCNLAWVYGTNPEPSIRNAKKALEFALRANELSGGNNPRILRLVAAAYAENGQFDEAIRVADKGAKLARDVGNLAMADVLMQNIASYQRNSPLRDSSQIR